MSTDTNTPNTAATSAAAPATTTTAAPAELPMPEYAASLEATLSGKPAPATAAATAPIETAAPAEASDEEPAEATIEEGTEGANASESANEDDAGQETALEDGKPAKKGINKRFSELTAEKNALKAAAEEANAKAEKAAREAEEAKAEVRRVRADAEQAALAAIPEVPSTKDDPEPVRGQFDEPEDYIAQFAAWNAREAIRVAAKAGKDAAEKRAQEASAAQQAENQKEMQRQGEELQKKFQTKVAEVKPNYPDFDEKVTNNADLMMRPDVFFAIQQTEDSAHLLYHIATNPKEAENLHKMNPMQAAIRLGELQGELRIARRPKISKAAEPVKPVGNRVNPQKKTPDQETMAEYGARRDREMQEEADRKRPSRAGNR